MNKSYKILLISLLAVLAFFNCAQNLNLYADVSDEKISFRDSISVIEFSVVGDLMCHSVQYKYAKTDSGYDFSDNYKFIKPYLNNADFTIGNLETTLAGKGKGYSGYPLFNTPDEYVNALKDTGFDLLITANNHSLDKWEKGLIRTIDKIEEVGLNKTGTFRSQSERDSLVIYKKNGISFTVFAYSYGTNGIPVPKGKDYLINLIDTTLISTDIQKAKEKGVDLVIVYYHFGEEYSLEPSNFQENIVRKTIEYGADIILGSHPHVPQPVEFFKTKNAKLDSGFVAYSLGNFISNQRWRYSDGGPILNFSIIKDNARDTIYLNGINVIPTWVFKGKIGSYSQYIILPSDSLINQQQYPYFTDADRKSFVQSYRDILEIMSKRTDKIKFHSPEKDLLIKIKKLTILPTEY